MIIDDFADIKRRLRGDDWFVPIRDQKLAQPAKIFGLPAPVQRNYLPSPYDLADEVDGGAST